MNPQRKFFFKTPLPSIELVIDKMRKHSGLNLELRKEVIKNPRNIISSKLGFDLGVNIPQLISYFIFHPDMGYEIEIVQSTSSQSISFFVQHDSLTYLESTLILTLFGFGGELKIGSEILLDSIPYWAKTTYLIARKEKEFIL